MSTETEDVVTETTPIKPPRRKPRPKRHAFSLHRLIREARKGEAQCPVMLEGAKGEHMACSMIANHVPDNVHVSIGSGDMGTWWTT